MYNLCLLVSHFYPVKSSCSSLFKDLIKSLLKKNFKITIITISGTKDKIKVINTKKLTYIGLKNRNLHSSNNYLRALGEIKTIFKIRNFINKKKLSSFDEVIVYTPTIFWSLLLLKLKKKLVTIKMADLYPKWLVDHKILNKFSFSFFFLKFFELLLYFQADRVYVQTPKDMNYIRKYKKFFNFEADVLYNWIYTDNLVNKKNSRKNQKYIRFIFIGMIGLAQDYELLFRMIQYCKTKNFKATFYFVGLGTKKSKLIQLTSGYKNVFFINEMSLSPLDQIIQKCDICLSTLNKYFKSDNFPGKILRYMVNNKPILIHSPNNGFLKDLIEKNSLGFYSSKEEDFFKNIEYIFSNFDHLKKKGIDGFNMVKNNYSSDTAVKILFK